ncbi:MAG: tetratricopeptide repeat protein [Myxococcota bacterium]
MPAGRNRPPEELPADDPESLGWIARLEAARRIASGKPPPPVDLPGTPETAADGQPSVNPAHMLVAQLEEEEAERKNGARAGAGIASADAIARAKVNLPPPAPVRRLPEWVWAALLVMLVAVSLGYAYLRATSEQALPYEVDPVEHTRSQTENDLRVLKSLNQGHKAALDGQHRAAISYYKAALAIDPELASAERGLGIAYAALDDHASAIRHYERFIALQPETLEAARVKKLIESYKRKQR